MEVLPENSGNTGSPYESLDAAGRDLDNGPNRYAAKTSGDGPVPLTDVITSTNDRVSGDNGGYIEVLPDNSGNTASYVSD